MTETEGVAVPRVPQPYSRPSSGRILLHAAYRHANETGEPRIDLSELVLAAWRYCPGRFGLKGHEKAYPDTNRVVVTILESTGPIRMGWMRRTAPRTYCVTPEGAELCRREMT